MKPTLLEFVAIILLILWTLARVSAYSMGGAANILLLVAVIIIMARLIQARRI